MKQPVRRADARIWLSWALALAILAGLLTRSSPSQLVEVARLARLDQLLILVAGACGLWLVLESTSLWTILGPLHRDASGARLSWGAVLSVRARSYLLTPIHWNLGRAGFVYQLERVRDVPMLESSSALLLQQSVDIWLFAGCAGLGLASLPTSPQAPALTQSIAAIFLALSLLFVLLGLLQRTPASPWAPIERIRQSRLAAAFRRTRPRELLRVVLLRGVHCLVFVAVYAWGTAVFGLDLPLAVVLAGVPVIQTVGALPITPAGLGTQQATMLLLFSPYGSESAILAFGLAFVLLQTVLRFAIGLASLLFVWDPAGSPPTAQSRS
jgi:uncharacterized membrane protein YbhN (UPF0104 family)